MYESESLRRDAQAIWLVWRLCVFHRGAGGPYPPFRLSNPCTCLVHTVGCCAESRLLTSFYCTSSARNSFNKGSVDNSSQY